MQVFFDDQIFHLQKAGGISRYFTALAQGLAQNREVEKLTLFGGWTRNEYLGEFKRDHPAALVWRPRTHTWRINSHIKRGSRLWRRLAFRRRHRRGGLVYHPTFYELDPGLVRGADATVLTFFDLIPEWAARQKGASVREEAFFRQRSEAVDRADGIVCISASTERDLFEYYPAARGKTRVIYLGSDFNRLRESAAAVQLPETFFLFVGQRGGYKNGLSVFGEFARLRQDYPSCKLVFFGGGNFGPEERELLVKLDLESAVVFLQGGDEVLMSCYLRATALIYPSLYEGFGLPVLEAMQVGCPVIAVKRSSVPEVGGEAALYEDPDIPGSLAGHMKTLLGDPAERAARVEAGYRQSRLFSWDETARQTAAFYESLLGARALAKNETGGLA